MYGMATQIRRAAVSGAASIASEHSKPFVHFLRVSQGLS
jgi:hypothetical protein